MREWLYVATEPKIFTTIYTTQRMCRGENMANQVGGGPGEWGTGGARMKVLSVYIRRKL